MLTVSDLSQARERLLNLIPDSSAGTRTTTKTSSILVVQAVAESVDLANALGRVLAVPVVAPDDVPGFDRSQVDGLAVQAADTFGASESLPAILSWAGEVTMGQPATCELHPGECIGVPTGGMLPPGADAMVMIEYVELLDATTRLVSQSVSPGNHVTRRGDDIRSGQPVLPAGHLLRAYDLGAIAALGYARVDVRPVIRIGILSTGDELIEPTAGTMSRKTNGTAKSASGTIFDVNGPMLAGAVRSCGCEPVSLGIVPDRLDHLSAALQRALHETDLVLISGGSSVGTRDYVEQAIQLAGQSGVLLHGLAVKPGKPTLAGFCDGKIVMGLPGHPVAAWFMFEQLVKPLLSKLSGLPLQNPQTVRARTACRIPSNHGREEFVLVRLIEDPDHPSAGQNGSDALFEMDWLAQPMATRSGLITQMTTSDGYLRIPRDSEGLPERAPVTVYLLHELQDR